MTAQNKITWSSTLRFGSDLKWIGHHPVGTFTIKFRHAADGRCIFLRHGDAFAGAFRTEAAAKRQAAAIVRRATAAAVELEATRNRVRREFAAAGLDAGLEIEGFAEMTAADLRDQLTYLADYQG